MIKVHFTSGLGNQLYQYFYGESLKKLFQNIDIAYCDSCLTPYQQNIWDIFDYQANEIFDKSKIKMFNPRKYLRVYLYKILINFNINLVFNIHSDKDKSISLINNGKKMNFYGYWQKSNFIKNYETIKKNLNFKYQLNFTDLDTSLGNFSDIVGVHVRGGDFLSSKNKDYLVGVNSDYYLSNIKFLIKKLDNPIFIFFTDDEKYLKTLIKKTNFPYRFIFEISNNRMYDFQYLSLCDHFILPNSTFGSWAAFFSTKKNKIIINPYNPLINDTLNQSSRNI